MDQDQSPLHKLTLAGRFLLLAHLLAGIGGSALYMCDFLPQLPAGRYPILMFLIPVGITYFFSFLIIAWVLKRLGIPIYRR